MQKHQAFDVTVGPEVWEQTGSENDRRSRLLASAIINGRHFHMEAYATDPDASEQRLADSWFEDEWRGLCLLEPDGAFETQEIEGRAYIVILRPHCT